jgi:hypothetical protein
LQTYKRGYEGVHRDPLIGLGTAPLDDPYFRAALFEQLGNNDLEGPVTTDIAGKKDAHALRLDRDADEAVKKSRLHQKVATTILFESNGGMTKNDATVPEIRLAVAEPELDIANVESALEALDSSCYYLRADHNRYRFSMSPNLNKLLTDRRSGVSHRDIDERVKQVVQEAFKTRPSGLEWVPFPDKSAQVSDRPALTLVVMSPTQGRGDPATLKLIDQIVREHGQSGRTFKSGLLFTVAENDAALRDEARKLLAWEDIQDDAETVKRLDDGQKRQLDKGVKSAARDLKEAVWRAYKYLLLLGRDNTLQEIDVGLVNSSAAGSLAELYVNRLLERDEITMTVSPNKLIKAWPPANKEWTTKAVRDAFFSSPMLPRLLKPNAIQRTIADGVNQKLIAYAGKTPSGRYDPLTFEPDTGVDENDIEISDEMVIIRAKDVGPPDPPTLTRIEVRPSSVTVRPGESITFTATCFDQHGHTFDGADLTWSTTGGTIDPGGRFTAEEVGQYRIEAGVGSVMGTTGVSVQETTPLPLKGLAWRGNVPPQKWMNFYTKVLSRFASYPGLALEVSFRVAPGEEVTEAKIEEAKAALRELGLSEESE